MATRRASLPSLFFQALAPTALVVVLSTLATMPREEFLWVRVWLLQIGASLTLALLIALVSWGLGFVGSAAGGRPTGADVAAALSVGLLGAAGTWNLIPFRIPLPTALAFALLVALWVAAYSVVRWWAGRSGHGAREVALPLAGVALVPALLSTLLRATDVGSPVHAGAKVAALVLVAVFALLALRGGRRRRIATLVLAVVASLLVRGLGTNNHDLHVRGELSQTAAEGPPVFLIVFDDCRADAVDLSDPATSNTPNLAELARGADAYPNAIANASWTLPGHTSLFTGQPLHVHRTDVTPIKGFQPFLQPGIPLAQEILVLSGYRTSGITANEVVGYRTGVTRGFHRYRIPGRDWLLQSQPVLIAQLFGVGRMPELTQLLVDFTDINRNGVAEEVTRYAIEEVDEALAGDHPLYLFLNYMDVHRPYPGPPGTSLGTRLTFWRDHFKVLTNGKISPERFDATLESVHDYYYHGAARIDRAVGELLDHLRETGIFDESLIIITADHGEAFHENLDLPHYFGHNGAYEPVVRIPFMVKWPAQTEGRVVEETVQQTDVVKMVAAATGISDLARLGASDRPVISEWYPRLEGHGGLLPEKRLALYEGPIKYVRTKGGVERAFDLDVSPFEKRTFDPEPEQLEELRGRFDTIFTEDSDEESTGQMDPELRKQLEALGYIG